MPINEFQTQVYAMLRDISLKIANMLGEFYQPFGVTPVQATILLALESDGPQKISDVAKHLNMTPSNLSMICRRLERDGFLSRSRDERDQRVVRLKLTERASQVMCAVQARALEDRLPAFSKISPEDQQLILDGITRLREVLYAGGES